MLILSTIYDIFAKRCMMMDQIDSVLHNGHGHRLNGIVASLIDPCRRISLNKSIAMREGEGGPGEGDAMMINV